MSRAVDPGVDEGGEEDGEEEGGGQDNEGGHTGGRGLISAEAGPEAGVGGLEAGHRHTCCQAAGPSHENTNITPETRAR